MVVLCCCAAVLAFLSERVDLVVFGLSRSSFPLSMRCNDDGTPLHGGNHVPTRLPAHLLAALHARLRRATLVSSRGLAPSPADSQILELLHDKFGGADESLPTLLARLDVAAVSFRPDIAVFVRRPRSRCPRFDPALWADPAWRVYEGAKLVHIVELGYVREGFAAAKQLQKRSQHRLLATLLRDIGWTVHYHTVTLGVAGTVYRDLLACLSALGVPALAAQSVVASVVRTTLNLTHGLVVQRRELDGHLIGRAFRDPP